MLDFRKSLLAFAALALLVVLVAPASAQIPNEPPLQCNTSSNPNTVRAEGITELVGDVVLTCTGGTPTLANQPIPQSNIILGLNTNITSRLYLSGGQGGAIGAPSGGFIDALLLIDDPKPASGQNPASPASTSLATQSAPCFSNFTASVACNNLNGTSNNVSPPGLAGAAPVPYVNANCTSGLTNGKDNGGGGGSGVGTGTAQCSNVFVAHQQDAAHVSWQGIPIDPPGTASILTLRMTNIRGNMSQLGVSSTLVSTQVFAFISVTGSQTIIVNQAQVPVAFIFQGLIVGSTAATALQQCVSLNVGIPSSATNFFATTGANGNAEFAVSVKEGFAAAFKRRIAPIGFLSGSDTIGFNGPTNGDGVQNLPGFNYNTESGFTITSGSVGSGASGGFGVADTATRFLIKFNNVGAGARIVAPIAVPLYTGTATAGAPPSHTLTAQTGGWAGGFLRLVAGTPDVNGNFGVGGVQNNYAPSGSILFGGVDKNVFPPTINGPFRASDPGCGSATPCDIPTTPWSQGVELTATQSGTTILAVYEVVNSDPATIETAQIPFGLAFTSNTGSNSPATGQTTASVSFAPLSTVATADLTAPVPRFTTGVTPANVYNITTCSCNLLFPFVTNQSGFDTGIAIANTSLDPYGTSPQSGTVKLNYYGGTTGGGAAPAAQTSQNVTAGTELIFTLSGGGNLGITATPGFQGYIIAQAGFQYCHAFAFLSYNIGAATGISQGYLALELDDLLTPSRTGNFGEQKAH